MEQSAHEHVKQRDSVANPDPEGIGSGAEACFWLERGAAQRETLAAEFDCVVNDCL